MGIINKSNILPTTIKMISKYIPKKFFAVQAPKLTSFSEVPKIKHEALQQSDVESLIKNYNLNGWSFAVNKVNNGDKHIIQKNFVFKNFAAAFSFMDNVAYVADEMDHHPEWTNKNAEVVVNLSTHDVGNKISFKDIILAKAMENINERVAGLSGDVYPFEH